MDKQNILYAKHCVVDYANNLVDYIIDRRKKDAYFDISSLLSYIEKSKYEYEPSEKIFTGFYDANNTPIYVGDIVKEGCNGLVAKVIIDFEKGYWLEGLGEGYGIENSDEWEVQTREDEVTTKRFYIGREFKLVTKLSDDQSNLDYENCQRYDVSLIIDNESSYTYQQQCVGHPSIENVVDNLIFNAQHCNPKFMNNHLQLITDNDEFDRWVKIREEYKKAYKFCRSVFSKKEFETLEKTDLWGSNEIHKNLDEGLDESYDR